VTFRGRQHRAPATAAPRAPDEARPAVTDRPVTGRPVTDPPDGGSPLTDRPVTDLLTTDQPDEDREGQPIIFDSYDMSPVLLGTGKCERNTWFYFTENELSPGAVRTEDVRIRFQLN